MTIQHLSRPLAVKSLAADGTFVGYASVFDEVDSQNEVVIYGAFSKTLELWQRKNAAPAMLWMHDPSVPIGLWLALAEDRKGLIVHGKLALSTQKGREAYELLKMKAVSGLSIGYRIVTSRIDTKRKVRILTEVDLFEISLVTFPANDAARISEVKAGGKALLARGGKTGNAKRPVKGKTDAAATRAVVARLHQTARILKEGTSNKEKRV
ncbi:MAG: HK97 family phage prohead protease [Alphaproteobacteria bacterium]|nr:HK97 family phage prohead protease [Alphaproteobacteria bacterium]